MATNNHGHPRRRWQLEMRMVLAGNLLMSLTGVLLGAFCLYVFQSAAVSILGAAVLRASAIFWTLWVTALLIIWVVRRELLIADGQGAPCNAETTGVTNLGAGRPRDGA